MREITRIFNSVAAILGIKTARERKTFDGKLLTGGDLHAIARLPISSPKASRRANLFIQRFPDISP